jgi:hypothetical protein
MEDILLPSFSKLHLDSKINDENITPYKKTLAR